MERHQKRREGPEEENGQAGCGYRAGIQPTMESSEEKTFAKAST